jgi:hypothetical protein
MLHLFNNNSPFFLLSPQPLTTTFLPFLTRIQMTLSSSYE